MSNRLTHSQTKTPGIFWGATLGWLALICGLAVWNAKPLSPGVLPEEAHRLYRGLASPQALFYAQSAVLVGLFLASGALLPGLLPAKTTGGIRILALVCGTVIPLGLLTSGLAPAMGPEVLYPAWLLALISIHLQQTSRKGFPLLCHGLSGLTIGLALSLDSSVLPAVLPTAFCILTPGLRAPKTHGKALGVWIGGLVAGLIPVFVGLTPFAPLTLTADHSIRRLLDLGSASLPLWSLPLLVLALLAAGWQRQLLVWGWMVPVGLLQTLFTGFTPGEILPSGAFFTILPITWLIAYGGFRLLRGVEQGIRNVNPIAARRFISLLNLLLLFLGTLWVLMPLFPCSP
jgi:hypothetical protein